MQQFNIGDWVKCTNKNRVFQITKENFNINTSTNNPFGWYELWQPKDGEWCWFWNVHMQTPILLQFSKMENEYFKTIFHYDSQIYWKYCEPFIGELPSFLKE